MSSWCDRNRHIIATAAAAAIWYPLPPRNTTHALVLELKVMQQEQSSEGRKGKTRFRVLKYFVATLAELNREAASGGGLGSLPEGPPNRMLVLVLCEVPANVVPQEKLGGKQGAMVSLWRSLGVDEGTRRDIEAGRTDLPPFEKSIIALLQ